MKSFHLTKKNKVLIGLGTLVALIIFNRIGCFSNKAERRMAKEDAAFKKIKDKELKSYVVKPSDFNA